MNPLLSRTVLLFIPLVALAAFGAARRGAPVPATATATLPLHFVANRGQWNSPAEFVLQHGPLTAHFGPQAWVLDLRRPATDPDARPRGVAVKMSFEGASDDARLEGVAALPGRLHFLRGQDPAGFRTGVAAYASIVHRGLYAGIDVRVHGDTGDLEYDLQLAPGADLDQVSVRCEGIVGMSIDASGALVFETVLGPIRQSAPTTWEVTPAGERRPVECRYRILDGARFGFSVPRRDERLALVIDPVLKWSTYLGGTNHEIVLSLAQDPSGDVIVAGGTGSRDYPPTVGAYDPGFNGTGFDSFVSRLSADGSTLRWSTFLGGSRTQYVQRVVRDASGAFVVTGVTDSRDFPTTAGSYQPAHAGGANFDAFVSRLSADGSALLYSTYLGGTLGDWTVDMALDRAGDVTVVGCTASLDFPTTPGAYDRTYNGGPRDAFVTTLRLGGNGPADLIWSTYLGGSADEGDPFQANNLGGMRELHVATDTSGATTVAGRTTSTDFPVTAGAYDTSLNGDADVFVARLGPGGSSLLWATFYGGSLQDGRAAVAVDRLGCPIVTGFTNSADLPTTPGAFSATLGGTSDAFVIRLDPCGSTLLYATYVGGPGIDEFDAIAVDAGGTLTLFGQGEAGFPTTAGAWSTTYGGGVRDGVIVRLRTDGNGRRDLRYSTYFGGSLQEAIWAGAWDGISAASFAGATGSTDLPTTPGAYDRTFNGGAFDAFVARLELLPTGVAVFGTPSQGCAGNPAIGVSAMPQIGAAAFAVTCTDGPAHGGGVLFLGAGRLPSPIRVFGIDVWLDPFAALVTVSASSDQQGYAEVGVPIPPVASLVGSEVFGQFIWPSPCGPQGLSASNAVHLTVQQ